MPKSLMLGADKPFYEFLNTDGGRTLATALEKALSDSLTSKHVSEESTAFHSRISATVSESLSALEDKPKDFLPRMLVEVQANVKDQLQSQLEERGILSTIRSTKAKAERKLGDLDATTARVAEALGVKGPYLDEKEAYKRFTLDAKKTWEMTAEKIGDKSRAASALGVEQQYFEERLAAYEKMAKEISEGDKAEAARAASTLAGMASYKKASPPSRGLPTGSKRHVPPSAGRES